MAERTVTVGIRMQMAGAITAVRNYRKAWVDARDELQKNVLTHRDAISTLSQTATVAGAVLVAGVGYAIKKFADFDAQMSNVNAALRETDENMTLLREAALDAGKTTVFSATEAAQAIEELGKAGISTDDILSGGLNGALSLAAAGQLSVADAAELAALAMQQFGLSGDKIPHVADLLAAAAGKSLGSVEDLRMALQQSGLVLNQFGISIEDGTGALAAFASAGLIGSDAGTSLKTMLLMLANPSKEAAGLMEELGIHAYDAAGQFVGLESLAGQLQSQMSGLTQAERDAALATIFGSDAVRAANVLYSEGSSGIAEWGTAVNDAGYASEVAADRLDNLQGDLKTLQSSLETALIETGSGANTVLRTMVQTVTDAVNAFASLPGPLQTTLLAVGGISGAGLLAVGGLGSLIVKTAETREAFNELRNSTGRVGSALRGMSGFLMGPWGIAIGAAVAVFGMFVAQQAEARAKTQQLTDTLDRQTGAITDSTRVYLANELQMTNAFETAEQLGISQEELVNAILSGNEAIILQNDKVLELSNNTSGLTDEEKVLLQHAQELRFQIMDLNGTYGDAVEASENRRAALGDEGTATEEISGANEVLAQTLGITAQSAEEAAEAFDELDEKVRALIDSAFALNGAQRDVEAGIDNLTEKLEENGATLDEGTEKGRENEQAIEDQIAAIAQLAVTTAEQTGSTEEANAVLDEQRAALERVLRSAGFTEEEIQEYISVLDRVPGAIQTAIQTKGVSAAINQMENIKAWMNSINRTVTISFQYENFMPRGGAAIPRKDGGIVGYADGGLPSFPNGGMFRGAGGPRSDSNLVAISDGEFIVNAADTRRHRSLLEAVNSGRFRQFAGHTPSRPVQVSDAGVRGGSVLVRFDSTGLSDSMARAIRDTVRVEGNGNVQAAFGSR
jgi:TP901 family phage tail tape measure protein